MNVLSHKSSHHQWISYPGVLVGRSEFYFPVTKTSFKKKKFHTAAALLLQHVEMQCEKGIKPLMHKRKRGKKIAVTALAKPSYIHTLSNTHTRLCEILKRATGEGRGTTKGMKGRKSQAEGGGIGAENRQAESEEETRSGKVTDGESDGSTLSRSHPRVFFPSQNDVNACSSLYARKPRKAIICPINHICHISVFFPLQSFSFKNRTFAQFSVQWLSSPRVSCKTPLQEIQHSAKVFGTNFWKAGFKCYWDFFIFKNTKHLVF